MHAGAYKIHIHIGCRRVANADTSDVDSHPVNISFGRGCEYAQIYIRCGREADTNILRMRPRSICKYIIFTVRPFSELAASTYIYIYIYIYVIICRIRPRMLFAWDQ